MTDLFSAAASTTWEYTAGELGAEEAAGVETMFAELEDRTHDRRSWVRLSDGATVTITVWRRDGFDLFVLLQFSGAREVIGSRPTS